MTPPVIDILSSDDDENFNDKNLNSNEHVQLNFSTKIHDQCLRKEETSENIKALNVVLKEIIAIVKPSDLSTMVTIAQKTWKWYDSCDPEFRDSESFLEIIRHNHSMLIENIDKKFVYLKRITDTMKDHKQQARRAVKRVHLSRIGAGGKKNHTDSSKAGPSSVSNKNSSDSSSEDDEPEPPGEEQTNTEITPEQQARNERNLKMLTRAFKACQKKIKELEAREVDFNEDADSAYLQEDRYKKRLVQIVEKINKIENIAPKSYKKKILFNGTAYPGLNKRVEQFVNKKKRFPDFKKILEVFAEANQELDLKIPELLLQKYAEEAFRIVGTQIQRHRCHELQESLGLLIPDNEVDPAEHDPELESKLRDNQQSYANREAELMALYTQKSEEKKQRRAAVGKEGEDDTDEDHNDEDDEEEEESAHPEIIEDLLKEHVSDSDEDMDDCKSTASRSSIKEEDGASQSSLQGKILPSPEYLSPVSTPGNTPNDEINLVTSEDSNAPSQTESNTDSSQSQVIQICEAFSIAENPEKLPMGIKSIDSDSSYQSEPKVKPPQKSNLSISKTKSESVKSFKTFSEAFTAHLAQKSEDGDDEVNKKNSLDIDEELKDILEESSLDISDVEFEEKSPSVTPSEDRPISSNLSEEVTQSDIGKLIISKIEPVKLEKGVNRPLLSLSPKLTLNIPSTLPEPSSSKPKLQRARKTFSWAQSPITASNSTSRASSPIVPNNKTPNKTTPSKLAQVSSPSGRIFSTSNIKITPATPSKLTQVGSSKTPVRSRDKLPFKPLPRFRTSPSDMGIMRSPASKVTSSTVKNEPMQTHEISSSSQDRIDSDDDDDDCIILD